MAGEAVVVVHEPTDAPLDGPPSRDDFEAAGPREPLDGVNVDAETGAVVDCLTAAELEPVSSNADSS